MKRKFIPKTADQAKKDLSLLAFKLLVANPDKPKPAKNKRLTNS